MAPLNTCRSLLTVIGGMLGDNAHGLQYSSAGPGVMPVLNEVVLVKGSLVPFQNAFIPELSSMACLEAYCTPSSLKPANLSDLELTGTDPRAVDDTRLDVCLLRDGNQNFTWTLDRTACDSLTVIVHEPFSRGVRSSVIEFAMPAQATLFEIEVSLPRPSLQQIVNELSWRLARALGGLSSLQDATGAHSRGWKQLALSMSQTLHGYWVLRWVLILWALYTLRPLLYRRNSRGAAPKKRRTRKTLLNARPSTGKGAKHEADGRLYEYSTSMFDDEGQEKVEVSEMRNAKDKIWSKLVSDPKTRAMLVRRNLGAHNHAIG